MGFRLADLGEDILRPQGLTEEVILELSMEGYTEIRASGETGIWKT